MIQREFQEQVVELIVDILCDICGESCITKYGNFEYMKLETTWGYGTNLDGTTWVAEVCEKCVLDKLQQMVNFKTS